MRFWLLLTIFLCSCAHTRVAARPIPDEAVRLATINGQPLSFHVDCDVDEIVGHQFLFVIFPFGRISLEDPKKHLSHALYREIAVAGFSPHETEEKDANLIVRCTDLSLSGYDYLLFRHIVATLELSIERPLIYASTPVVTYTRAGAFKAFAFHQQLEHLWTQAAAEAAHSAVTAGQ